MKKAATSKKSVKARKSSWVGQSESRRAKVGQKKKRNPTTLRKDIDEPSRRPQAQEPSKGLKEFPDAVYLDR